jgi:hypothetical protein
MKNSGDQAKHALLVLLHNLLESTLISLLCTLNQIPLFVLPMAA